MNRLQSIICSQNYKYEKTLRSFNMHLLIAFCFTAGTKRKNV
jgi:hypothetical protein